MERTERIVEVLGGEKVLGGKISTADELIGRLRTGLPYASLERVMTTFDIGREEVAATLNLPLRTIARRKKAHKLPPDESDRVFRFARVAAHAVAVLGSEDKAARWLHRRNRALGNATPLSLLDTDIGVRRVEAVLGRIEHGVVS